MGDEQAGSVLSASDGPGLSGHAVVTVYSTGPQCVQCTATIRRLTAAGIRYRLVELGDEGSAAAREYVTDELGYTQAPVVVVEDEPENHWSGFDPVRIDQLVVRYVRL